VRHELVKRLCLCTCQGELAQLSGEAYHATTVFFFPIRLIIRKQVPVKRNQRDWLVAGAYEIGEKTVDVVLYSTILP